MVLAAGLIASLPSRPIIGVGALHARNREQEAFNAIACIEPKSTASDVRLIQPDKRLRHLADAGTYPHFNGLRYAKRRVERGARHHAVFCRENTKNGCSTRGKLSISPAWYVHPDRTSVKTPRKLAGKLPRFD